MCRVAGRKVSWAVQRAASEVTWERQRGVWTRQRGRRGGQDQTFPVACSAAAVFSRQWQILQPPAPYYPRVIHGLMKSCGAPGGGFPSFKPPLFSNLGLDPAGLRHAVHTRTAASWRTGSQKRRTVTHRVRCHVEEESAHMSSSPILSGFK